MLQQTVIKQNKRDAMGNKNCVSKSQEQKGEVPECQLCIRPTDSQYIWGQYLQKVGGLGVKERGLRSTDTE